MNTQEAVLEILRKQPAVCAEDLSTLLLKTRANLQYHLARMEQAGWIEKMPNGAAPKRQGRPRHYYRLSSRSRANNVLPLTAALLAALFPEGMNTEAIQSKAEEIASLLLVPANLSSQKTLARQLNLLVKELTTKDYQARWEARAAGPSIVFHNCPYYDLLPNHPELCLVDAAMLKQALGRAVTQQSQYQLPKIPICRFLVENKS